MNETLGKIHFWLFFIGFNGTFLPMHWLGMLACRAALPTYDPQFQFWNRFASIVVVRHDDRHPGVLRQRALEHSRTARSPGRIRGTRGRSSGMIPSPPHYYNFKNIPTVYGLPYDFSQPLPYRGLEDELTDTRAGRRAQERIDGRRIDRARQSRRARSKPTSSTSKRANCGFRAFCCSWSATVVLFSSFIFAYLYLRNSGQGWPPPGINHLDVAFAALNSVVLFGSGATMHYALENWKHGNFMKYAWLLLSTIVLGARFLGRPSLRVQDLIFDEHVILGGQRHLRRVVLHAHRHARIPRLRRRLLPDGSCCCSRLHGVYTRQKFFGITAGTLYWHFVDVIWVVLFSIFYLDLRNAPMNVDLAMLERIVAIVGGIIVGVVVVYALYRTTGRRRASRTTSSSSCCSCSASARFWRFSPASTCSATSRRQRNDDR